MTDPHAQLRDRVLDGVFNGQGASEPAVRKAAAAGTGVPADLQALVSKIHRHAYKVTSDDLESLKSKYSEDQLFEIVVSAALGAARRRLLAGLDALEKS
jgi:alkylhydroperoxidase family enzyme